MRVQPPGGREGDHETKALTCAGDTSHTNQGVPPDLVRSPDDQGTVLRFGERVQDVVRGAGAVGYGWAWSIGEHHVLPALMDERKFRPVDDEMSWNLRTARRLVVPKFVAGLTLASIPV